MKIKQTFFAAMAALTLGTAASAQEVTLRIAHWVPPTHPIQTMGIEPWAEAVTKASNGRIAFSIFPAQQLGSAPDHYDMARDGIADLLGHSNAIALALPVIGARKQDEAGPRHSQSAIRREKVAALADDGEIRVHGRQIRERAPRGEPAGWS